MPDWASAVSRSIKYDLRAGDIGFGAEFFLPTADWTVNTWQFSLTLTSAAAIAAYDAFTAALLGPLNGFWLPTPLATAKILSAASTSVFTIAGQNLASHWNARPDQYLFFTFLDGSQAAAKIQSVVASGNNEVITLTTALSTAPDANTAVSRLHYVRLADDEERGQFYCENQMTRPVSVIELPEEYAAAQTGLQPIYLYHFWANAPAQNDWYYTSFAAPVASQNILYTNFPIDFSNLQNTSDGSADDLQIDAKPDPDSPLALFFPIPFSGTLYVTVMAISYADLDTQTLLFTGRVKTVQNDGIKDVATCESRLGLLRRKLPRICKGQTCQNVLYDQNTCKAGRAFFETTVAISSISATFPPQVVCTFLLPDFAAKFQAANYLAQGQFESGVGEDYEARTILASVWNAGAGTLTLTLGLPLVVTQAGANAQIVAGCDHTFTTCTNKFLNAINFVGFYTVPDRNPVIRAVNANSVAGGGK